MSRYHRLLLFFGVFVIFAAALRGDLQQTPLAQRAAGSVKTGVTAVLVDVVVRDKKGMPVRDLQPSEFEILEDGAPQTMGSFTPTFEAEASSTVPVATPAPAVAAGGSTGADGIGPTPAAAKLTPITALVFDRLSPEGRQLAVNAARAYVTERDPLPSMMGVFGIDLAFTPYAPFTKDRETLQKALDTIETRASTTFGIDREQKRRIEHNAATTQQQAEAAAGGGGANQSVGSSGAAAQLAQMESNMMAGFEALERDQQGYASVNGLFAIIGAMRQLPGRKSIVLFSEGVAIPPAVHRLFLGVIDAANRANVSIYTMDAAGLRTESEQAKIRDQVNQAGKRGLTSYAPGRESSGNQPLTKALELNEDVLRQDPHTGLGELAQGTGGLIFESTNNLRTGFDRVESDLRNYYLIGYTPTNSSYDGTFRKIEVKVKRPGLTVAARKGYFAVRDTGGAPVNTWEAAALAALDRRPVPNAFPVRAGGTSIPEQGTPRHGASRRRFEDRANVVPSDRGSEVVQIRLRDHRALPGSKGRGRKKVGQHYEMAAEMDKLTIAKNSDVIFYREPELPPGVYTMETIVYDNPSGKASVRYATVEVPKTDPARLRMSSLVLVKKGEKVPEGEPRVGPLFVKDVLIYPNLGEEVSKAARELGFFFTVYPAAGPSAPQAILELIQNGKPLAQVTLPLDAADASGQIRQVGRLPLGEIPAGRYELRVIVKQGAEQVFRSAMLHVAD